MPFTLDPETLKFDRDGLIPAIIQDVESGRVLMMAYMNREALAKTLASGETWFWSRSRQKLWHKGETSGHVQEVVEVYTDCDRDTLLLKVRQKGAACHEGYFSCFHHRVGEGGEWEVTEQRQFDPREVYGEKRERDQAAGPAVIEELYGIIKDRREKRPEGSYTAKLFDKGLDKMLEKLGEEVVELIIEAKNRDREEVVEEAADVLYHLLVVLAEQGIPVEELFAELARRRK
ncbi:bifunctional phosphoribosyl-AMP cyclohydrolase/phosphoribosyl-ATP diphosphatase HisIE [Desulfovirgula thermocuniculi]|uniref:bifunctional phosphoribosyl-AMP cyclohydrolase/phosphoribosyl-ATP diphosphatase HisIE n=1 Tax=Desulfovirgula thermocuniculi TaxID=348842 RepID=UPI00041045F6|nr:bifunctional phosphoribosyl-AMP cyclohydrolase/phosphoribosyl-ATP diphosphatase HisIE [Desulfovirgula thermocuniculi]